MLEEINTFVDVQFLKSSSNSNPSQSNSKIHSSASKSNQKPKTKSNNNMNKQNILKYFASNEKKTISGEDLLQNLYEKDMEKTFIDIEIDEYQGKKKIILEEGETSDDEFDFFSDNEENNCKGKLKKFSQIQKEKKKLEEEKLKEKQLKKKERKLQKKIINELFMENEADLGSENDDDAVKDVRKEELEEYKLENQQLLEEEKDAFLEGLVDKEFELKGKEKIKDEKFLKEKFLEDEMRADKEMIKKIINFDHNKRKNKLIDEGVISEDENDVEYIPIEERIQKSGIAEEFLGNENFKFQLFKHLKKKKADDEKIMSENEETKEMTDLREENQVKKYAEQNSVFIESFKNRMKENKDILARNVVNANDDKKEEESKFDYLSHDKKALYQNVKLSGGFFYSKTNSLLHKKQGLFTQKNNKTIDLTIGIDKTTSSLGNIGFSKTTIAEGNSIQNLSTLWVGGASEQNMKKGILMSSGKKIKNEYTTPIKLLGSKRMNI